MNPGDLMYIRTTDEPVIVLSAKLSIEDTILVRRPVASREGIYHEKYECYPYELETPKEHVRRKVEEQREFEAAMYPPREPVMSAQPKEN